MVARLLTLSVMISLTTALLFCSQNFGRLTQTAVAAPPVPPDPIKSALERARNQELEHLHLEKFSPGPYPKLEIITSSKEGKPEIYSLGSSMATAGKILPALHCEIKIEFFQVTGNEIAARPFLSMSFGMTEQRDTFTLNNDPPNDGWPAGMLLKRVSILQMPQVYVDEFAWIVGPNGEGKGQVPNSPELPNPYADAKQVILGTPFTANQEIGVSKSDTVAFCGRFPDASREGLVSGQPLVFRITRQEGQLEVTCHSVILFTLMDGKSCWFEHFRLPHQNKNLRSGEYKLTLSTTRKRQLLTQPLIVAE
jgi:hypothetical protein